MHSRTDNIECSECSGFPLVPFFSCVFIMKARIQAYWDAEVKLNPAPEKNGAEERLERGETARICDISIDGKLKGSVLWNGKELAIEKLCI